LSTPLDKGKPFVEIRVQPDVVYLTGLVESYAQKWAIDRAVRCIVGVKGRRDFLHVGPLRLPLSATVRSSGQRIAPCAGMPG
jgi:hypothetical protein